jgi:exosortase/archaeosortase family protein
MNLPSIKFPQKLVPFKGVILFAVVLILSNFFWKYNVLGDEAEDINSTVRFWGMDISAPFIFMAYHVAHVSESVLRFFGSSVILKPGNILGYSNGSSVVVIWACTGLKQAYICFCILAFARGPWLKKLWYIPLSLLVVYLFNIFRITFIVACIENHPDWFKLLHLYVFKYIFYGIIFLMWVYWEEKVVVKEKQTAKIE